MSSTLQGATGAQLAFNSGALAIGSTPSQFAIAAAINYALGGRFLQRATIASQALVIEPNSGINPVQPNAFVTLAAGEACAFAVLVDAAGVLTVAQGPVVPAGLPTPVPAAPGNKVIVGAIKVSNVTNPFIPGTTAFNAAGVTATYVNLASHPGAPI